MASATTSRRLEKTGSLLLRVPPGLVPALDDLLLDVGGDGLVGGELQGEGALAAGHALEVGGVAEDLAQGGGGLDDLEAAGEGVHAGDVAAAGREVGGDVAELGRRDGDLQGDD